MKEEKTKENKRRFTLWIKPSVLELAEENFQKDNCGSVSEFIERAVSFYAGYVTAERNQEYLPSVVISTLKSIIRESDNRLNRNLFKLCVEMSMMMNVLASKHWDLVPTAFCLLSFTLSKHRIWTSKSRL